MRGSFFMNRVGLPQSVLSIRQTGLTLVELMISIALGLIVLLAATTLLLSSKAAYLTQNDSGGVQETARFAIENISRSVRQAGYENWAIQAEKPQENARFYSWMEPNITGLDAKSLSSTAFGIDSPLTASINGSDVLAVRFFGISKVDTIVPDGTVFDCVGNDISAPVSQDDADWGRGWSIYYVAKDAAGEPELRCKYRADSTNKWNSEAIARGVESFQVLYGVDCFDGDPKADCDSIPKQFLTATQINAKDAAIVPVGANADEKTKDKSKRSLWKKVLVLQVAILVRGTENVRADGTAATYHLFGKDYSAANAANDKGVQIKEADLTADKTKRRKVFLTVIQLRNQSSGNGAEEEGV